MDPQDDIAEERLLRLIETTGADKSLGVEVPAKGVGGKAVALKRNLHFAFQAWRLNLLNPSTTLVREPLRYLTYTLWVVLASLSVYMVSQGAHFYMERFESKRFQPAAAVNTAPAQQPAVTLVPVDGKVKGLEAQLEPLRHQNPFTGITEQQVVTDEAPKEPAKPQLSQLIEGLTLVGVNRGAGPEAFIEDKSQNRTYFVKVGQTVRNLKVKSIGTDNSVVLESEGEEVTLS